MSTKGAGGPDPMGAEGERYADMKVVPRTSTREGAKRPSINSSPEERM